jgi:hypothetical protein
LCTYSPPLAMNSSNTNQEKNEMLCMRFKIRVLHKAYKQIFKQHAHHYAKTYKTRVNPHKETITSK